MGASILVVDDERSMREFLQILLEQEGYEVTTAESVARALASCSQAPPDVIFADLKLPDGTGMDVLAWAREHATDTQVIMMTAFATTQNAVEAMRMGAYDYQMKPFKVDEIRELTHKALEKNALLRENRELKAQLRSRSGLSRIVGRSPKMREVTALIEKVAPTRTNILIEGESGTGKELVARAIHEASDRGGRAFVAVNCGAIPEALIESELFGHAAGAFTGAHQRRAGLFKSADGGTLLLDEVGELPMAMQVKLLRALEERAVRPVGEEIELPVDVRIIASTNRDLRAMVQDGLFREDLYYRLNVVRIHVPPLRHRAEDIPLLARAFLIKHGQELATKVEGIDGDAICALIEYGFPGNVRELENTIERALALASGPTIGLSDLPGEIHGEPESLVSSLLTFPQEGLDLETTLNAIETRFIREALDRTDGVKKRAAQLLKLSFRSFRYRLEKLQIDRQDEPKKN